jgi:release factor glutamine methyltransferase
MTEQAAEMRPAEVVRRAADYLARHDVPSPRETAEALMAMVLGIDRASIYAREEGLDAREGRMFGRAICQRCAGTPLQHLTGEHVFRHVVLDVRPGVFIPRPETEILVEAALERLGPVDDPVIVDVGTGTGAVALSMKDERPDARVFATDIAPEAVELATSNAARLGLDVTVLEGHLLDPLPDELRGWVDLVVSNPPYITPQEYEDLPVEVRAEPVSALVGGVEVHEAIARDAARWLRDGGVVALEIGASQGPAVADILARRFAHVEVRTDLAGRDRVVLARRP